MHAIPPGVWYLRSCKSANSCHSTEYCDFAATNKLPIRQHHKRKMTTKFLKVFLQRRLTKVKITGKKDFTTSHTDETNSNVHSIENSCKVRAKIEQTISMDENSLRGVALLLNFKPLETTESGNFELNTESQMGSQRTKQDKSTRSWTWANLDWEGSLTDTSNSTSSAESSESEEYYEYIPPIECDEDPSDDEKTEMIIKWLSNSNLDLNESS